MQPRRPSLVIVAGPNGSGKTTLTRQVLQHAWTFEHEFINADEIAEKELGGWNDAASVASAARLADERREKALSERRNFAYETVFSTDRHLDLIRRARRAGYFMADSSPLGHRPDRGAGSESSRTGH